MPIKGRGWKFGDNVDTDQIIPAPYLNLTDSRSLGAHCMEAVNPSFASKVTPGDVIIAGKNFGCGSSREHAPRAIIGAGISAVIAADFARIFYRNAINTGLPILESPAASAEIKDGDTISIDLEEGLIRDESTGKEYRSTPFPEFAREIIRAGGLIPYVVKKYNPGK